MSDSSLLKSSYDGLSQALGTLISAIPSYGKEDDGNIVGLSDRYIRTAIPVGSLVATILPSAPDGWVFCEGKSFDTTRYPKLASLLNSNLTPDLRGVFIRGLDQSGTMDTDGQSRTVGSYQEGSIVTSAFNNAIYGPTTLSGTTGPNTPNGNTASGLGYDPVTQPNYAGVLAGWTSLGGQQFNATSPAPGSSPWAGFNFMTMRPKNVAYHFIMKAE